MADEEQTEEKRPWYTHAWVKVLVVFLVGLGLGLGTRGSPEERLERAQQDIAEAVQAEKEKAQAKAEKTQAKAEKIREQISPISFWEVDRKFGMDGSLTEIQKDDEWKKYKGQCVEWHGQLVRLDNKLFGGFAVDFKHRQDAITSDVQVSAPGSAKEQLKSWQNNRLYTYKATLKKYGGAFLPIEADWGCD